MTTGGTETGSSFTEVLCPIARKFGVGFAQWTVCELTESKAPHFGPALIFFSDGVGRRVRNYPANWRDLTDEQLYALSWNV